jgi:hypothetical protein
VLSPAELGALRAATVTAGWQDAPAGRMLAAVLALQLGAGLPDSVADTVLAEQIVFGPTGAGWVVFGHRLRPVHPDLLDLLECAIADLPAARRLIPFGGRARLPRQLTMAGMDPALLASDALPLTWLRGMLAGRPSLPLLDEVLLAGGTGLSRSLLERVLPSLPADGENPQCAPRLLAGTLPGAGRSHAPASRHSVVSPTTRVSVAKNTAASADRDDETTAMPASAARPMSRAAARRYARQLVAAGAGGGNPVAPSSTVAAVRQMLTEEATRQLPRLAPAARRTDVPVADNTVEVTAAIDTYTPSVLPADVWQRVGPLARRLLHASKWSNRARAMQAANHLAQMLAWAETRTGRPDPHAELTVGELLLPGLLDTYIKQGADTGRASSWDTKRSVLGAVLAAANPYPAVVIPYRVAAPPYSPAECAARARLARNQPTALRRAQLCAVVGLGLGAGLTGRSLRGVRPVDITELLLPDGLVVLQVAVRRPEPRTVVVRREHEPLVREALAAHLQSGRRPSTALIAPAGRRNVTSPVLDRAVTADSRSVDIDPSRLRNAWLVALMTDRLPVPLILSAAGLRSARTLSDLIRYTPLPDPVTASLLLAGQPGALLPAAEDAFGTGWSA